MIPTKSAKDFISTTRVSESVIDVMCNFAASLQCKMILIKPLMMKTLINTLSSQTVYPKSIPGAIYCIGNDQIGVVIGFLHLNVRNDNNCDTFESYAALRRDWN